MLQQRRAAETIYALFNNVIHLLGNRKVKWKHLNNNMLILVYWTSSGAAYVVLYLV